MPQSFSLWKGIVNAVITMSLYINNFRPQPFYFLKKQYFNITSENNFFSYLKDVFGKYSRRTYCIIKKGKYKKSKTWQVILCLINGKQNIFVCCFFWHKITNLIIGKSFSPLTKIFTLDQKPDLLQG